MIIYNWGITTLRKEISNSMVAQVSFYLDGLEKEIERIRTLQYDAITDQNLNRLAAIPESLNNIEKMQNILRLQHRLNAIKNSSVYISDVFAMIPAIDRKIGALTVSDFDSVEYRMLQYMPMEAEAQLMYIDDQIFLSVAYPYIGLGSKRDPIFIIAIELSKARIEEQLRTMTSNEEKGGALLNFSMEAVIATSANKTVNQQIQRFLESQENAAHGVAKTIYIENKPYLAVYKVSDYLGSILCKYVPQDSVFAALRKYQGWFLLLIVSAIIIIIIYSLYTYQFIHKPLNVLTKSFYQVENGNLSIHIEHHHEDEFRYIYRRFNVMVENLNTLIEQVYKQKILTQKSELKQLQSQINPHFLYNSFFILNTMSRIGDNDNLERFTEQLGKYFQFLTRNAADDVTLTKEVEHAKVYTEIQSMRFSNRIQVEFDELPEKYAEHMVPRLILQPIIENAFEHGLESMGGKGILKIRFLEELEEFQIIIEDSGNKIDEEEIKKIERKLDESDEREEVTGMMNIHQRIRLKYGIQSGLKIDKSELGGLKVVVGIHFNQ